MTIIVFLALACFVAYRATNPDERQRMVRSGGKVRQDLARTMNRWMQEIEPHRTALRERTRYAPMAPAMTTLNAIVFAGMLAGAGALDDPATIVGWGGSIGPRTANGEWWRLVTALFVHPGLLELLVNLAALLSLGFVLERLVGPVAFATVYFVSGLFVGLFNLSAFPVAVSAGAEGAIGGLYGLMVAVAAWGVARRPRLTMPAVVIKGLAVTGAMFGMSAMAGGAIGGVVVGFGAGLLQGLALAKGVNERCAPVLRIAATVPVMLSIAVATAVPLAGITDATRDLQAVVDLEDRSSKAFRDALDRFTGGRMKASTLADVIDRTVLPELLEVQAGLDALERVPVEQQPLVGAANEYVRLRAESWTLRSQALRTRRMAMLATADAREAAALDALRRIAPR